MKRLVLISIFAAVAVVSVQADYFGFNPITTNAPNRDAIGDQLFMSVSTLSATDSGVLFTNIGPASSSISEIYFGSNLTALDLNIESILASSPGVVFDITGATPPNPPGWNEFANWWSVTIAAAESTEHPGHSILLI